MTPTVMFFWMLVAHAVCDYPLQGDFLAKGKNHKQPIPGVHWMICLMAHSLIHAGAIMLITQNLGAALAEYLVHFWTDHLKCREVFGFSVDQAIHIGFKVVLVAWLSL